VAGSQGRGGLVGCSSSSASWLWRCRGPQQGGCSVPPPHGLRSTHVQDSAFPPHPDASSLAGSTELVPSIVSSSFTSVLLLGLLGALMVCVYIKKPVRPPSVLVRQPGTRHPLPPARGCRPACRCGRQVTSRDEAQLTPLFSLLPRSRSSSRARCGWSRSPGLRAAPTQTLCSSCSCAGRSPSRTVALTAAPAQPSCPQRRAVGSQHSLRTEYACWGQGPGAAETAAAPAPTVAFAYTPPPPPPLH